MSRRRARKELHTVEAFEQAFAEEVSVSAEFDLPMALISAARDEWEEDAIRRVLDSLRTADLVTHPNPSEILIILPNTQADTTQVVEERLRAAVPEAALGVAAYTPGDATEDLIERARDAGRA